MPLRQQQTIERAVSVSGFGFWSGKDVTLTFHPAPADAGITFLRTDLPKAARIPALWQHRIETPRRTTLTTGGGAVEMVEHVLAALAGLQIDNCEVQVNAAEMPGLDGSSQAFTEALHQAGKCKQKSLRRRLVVEEPIRVGNEDAWVEASPSKGKGLFVKYRLEYPGNLAIGRQTIELSITPETFRQELAPSRTFLLAEEAQWLQQQGLGARVSPRDVLVFDHEGPIENELRFEDECGRHKTLDLIGDLALVGCDIQAKIVAYRSGHRLNAELAGALLKEARIEEESRRAA